MAKNNSKAQGKPQAEPTGQETRQVEREATVEAEEAATAEAKEMAKYDVDEFAVGAFASMGVELTPAVAKSYCEFKGLKDKLQPGRLKVADFVTCVMLAKKGN